VRNIAILTGRTNIPVAGLRLAAARRHAAGGCSVTRWMEAATRNPHGSKDRPSIFPAPTGVPFPRAAGSVLQTWLCCPCQQSIEHAQQKPITTDSSLHMKHASLRVQLEGRSGRDREHCRPVSRYCAKIQHSKSRKGFSQKEGASLITVRSRSGVETVTSEPLFHPITLGLSHHSAAWAPD
jgi:hypothetical protein